MTNSKRRFQVVKFLLFFTEGFGCISISNYVRISSVNTMTRFTVDSQTVPVGTS